MPLCLRWRYYRRCLNLPVVLFACLAVAVVLASNLPVTLFRFWIKDIFTDSFEIHSSRWVLFVPGGTVTPHNLNIPRGWTIFVPRGSQVHNCSNCFYEGSSLDPYLRKWNHGIDLPNDSPMATVYKRMATVLFTMKHGAVSIMFTSDVNSLYKSMKRLLLDDQPDGVKGMEYAGSNLTLDSYHFHHKTEVELGNPCLYRIRLRMKPLWTVGIRCRATREPGMESPILVDEHAPPVFSSSPKFSINNYNDAFYDYEGLWAVFTTFVSAGEHASVWGLWAQRLAQEIAAETSLTSLPCPDLTLSLTMPKETSNKSHDVFNIVTTWTCPPSISFFECCNHLAQVLGAGGYITEKDNWLLTLWIRELKLLKYPEPKRRPQASKADDFLMGCMIHSPALVVATPGTETSLGKPKSLFPNIEQKCRDLPKHIGVKDPFKKYIIKDHSKVKDIALVVIFYDATIYHNIPYLEDLYRKYFSNLVYCGPDHNLFMAFYKTFKRPMTFIQVPDTKGFVAYECISRAIMVNYDVSGYLEMADDVILNTWTLGSVPRDRFWFQKDLRVASRYQQIMNDFALSYPFPWWPWTVHGQMWGAKAMAKVWSVFDDIRASNNSGAKDIINAFLETLNHNSGRPENFFYCSSDIFYVPATHRQAWSMLSHIFFKNNVFLDIGVPTLMNGMDFTANIVRLEGVYLWYNERANYPAFYRDFHQFFHPWKMNWINRSDHATFLCYYVLPHIVNDVTVDEVDANEKKDEKSKTNDNAVPDGALVVVGGKNEEK